MSFIRKIKKNGKIYLAEVENKRVDGRVKQSFIRYLGRDPESENSAFPSSPPTSQPSDIKQALPVKILKSVIDSLLVPDGAD